MIKNVVFDIGNVLVKWDPFTVISSIFPEQDPQAIYQKMYPAWLDLNLGKLSEPQAILIYQQKLNTSIEKINKLLFELKHAQVMLPGMRELLHALYTRNIPLYSITDNVKELLEYHSKYSNFLHYFKGIVSSSDLGSLKPSPKNYQYLLDHYQLQAKECVFIDDLMANVNGAIAVGMYAFQFINANQCTQKLNELQIFI